MKNGEHPSWTAAFSEYRKLIDETKVSVVILGPGKGNVGFDKRVKIKEHLAGLSKYYDVAFPEDIKVPPDLLPNGSEWIRIGFVVGNAGVIIALLINDIKVSGVLTEVTKYEDHEGFREKAFLLVPKEHNKAHKSGPLIWQAANYYPRAHRLIYKDDELATCLKIRDFVGSVVDEHRKQIAWREFQKRKGMNPS